MTKKSEVKTKTKAKDNEEKIVKKINDGNMKAQAAKKAAVGKENKGKKADLVGKRKHSDKDGSSKE